MTTPAAGETLYLGPRDGSGARERIDVEGYAHGGDLSLVDLRPSEQVAFAELAQQIDDGEAATLAVAIHRGWAFATDDRKARRLARTVDPPVELVTTPALLYGWAAEHDEPAERVSDVLHRIERRARFVPPRSDPHRDWWIKARQ